MAEIDPAKPQGEVVPVPVGAGDVLGVDHDIHTGHSHVTTALEIFTGFKAAWNLNP